MTLRQEVHSHTENIWILCLGQNYLKKPLSPLPDLIDWYNNQILTKAIVRGQMTLQFGDRTLISTSGLLPAAKIIVVGLGDLTTLNVTQARKLLQDLGQITEDLGETSPWLVLASDTPTKFVEEVRKSRTSIEPLSQSTISVG